MFFYQIEDRQQQKGYIDDFSKSLHSWHGIGTKMYNQIYGIMMSGLWSPLSIKEMEGSQIMRM